MNKNERTFEQIIEQLEKTRKKAVDLVIVYLENGENEKAHDLQREIDGINLALRDVINYL